MSKTPQDLLAGLTVLLVEDEFYQAAEAQDAFVRAGATVQGPFSTAAAAMHELEQARPDCAVIDINLGTGPEFDLARELKTRGIPTVFVSGYHAAIIPEDLRDLPYLGKPAETPALINAVRALVPTGR
ncbi:response regulator [Bradyrhizobium sp. GCM10027634]|uniref:response regulator n=1 Tax=unclassified Bradyrhizobium TaxID=2631580 RepID=UPI00188DA3DA|nr:MULTISPECIES: response regulator [unclassified Bradyrhizobium]MDN5001515.1 response regulator [Bradyrhizobium sp. WYCCWR 12677]